MSLIDSYVNAVIVRLPEKSREDVNSRLRARIAKMLPEDPSEGDIRAVLEKLGNPILLANEYRQGQRYLIGPELYDRYLSVLKLVLSIVPIVSAMIALIEGMSSAPADSESFELLSETFANMFSAAIEGATQAFFWVTFVFVVMERKGVRIEDLIKKKWSIDDLPNSVVSKRQKISRGETIFPMFFTVFFTALIYYMPQYIGWYTLKDSVLTLKSSLFVLERLQDYLPSIMLLAAVQLTVHIFKFIYMKWNLPIAIANTGYNVGMSILSCVMVADRSLFNPDFKLQFAHLASISLSNIDSIWSRTLWIMAGLIVFGCTIDSIMGFVKRKN